MNQIIQFTIKHLNTLTGDQMTRLIWGLGILFVVWMIFRLCHVAVPDGEVAVVFKSRPDEFIDFLPSGSHFLFPFSNKVKGILQTAEKTTSGTNEVRSVDGYTVTLEWTIAYRLDPFSIAFGLRKSMASILLTDPLRLAEAQIGSCLQKAGERFTMERLRRSNLQNSAGCPIKRSVAACLVPYGIIVTGLQVNPVQYPKSAATPESRTLNPTMGLIRSQPVKTVEEKSDLSTGRPVKLRTETSLGKLVV